jgi:hypothetical protein
LAFTVSLGPAFEEFIINQDSGAADKAENLGG